VKHDLMSLREAFVADHEITVVPARAPAPT
jgi:hypothetical protein